MKTHEEYLQRAIQLAREGMHGGKGGPFGAVLVLDGKIIGEGCNEVTSSHDPTAHAEVQAIRQACAAMEDFRLTGTTLYASCEPCPMCLSAIHWARIDRVYFAATRHDAASIGFDDALLYREIPLAMADRALPMQQLLADEGAKAIGEWSDLDSRVDY
jgi:tRNA(Arg) A34 adenosine deaminase TadA